MQKTREELLQHYLNELEYDPAKDPYGDVYTEANFLATIDFLETRSTLELPRFASKPSVEMVEEHLKLLFETMAQRYKEGDEFAIDDLAEPLAQALWGLISRQKNVPENAVVPRLPSGSDLLGERDLLRSQGIAKRNIASELAKKFHVTPGHARTMLNMALQEEANELNS